MPMIPLAELIDITSNLETLLSCHVSKKKKKKKRKKKGNLTWTDKFPASHQGACARMGR